MHSPYSLSERHSTQTTRGLIKNIFCSAMRKHCTVYKTFNPLVGLSNYWNILSLLNKLLNNWTYILLLLTKEILYINRIFMCVVSYLQILLLGNVWLGCVSGDQGSSSSSAADALNDPGKVIHCCALIYLRSLSDLHFIWFNFLSIFDFPVNTSW